jgi:hypothetical protein
MPGEQTMKPWEQRVTGWGALFVAVISLWLVCILAIDSFHNPFAPEIGVAWEKQRVVGGVNTAPVQYEDVLTLTNTTDSPLKNVELAVSNWASGINVQTKIGTLGAHEKRQLNLLDGRLGFPPGYEINPRDVVIVRATGYAAEKHIPVKELGKDKSLEEIAKDEDKENNADKNFWPKFWKWQDGLKKMGIEPTEDMFKRWLKEKEDARRKEKGQ